MGAKFDFGGWATRNNLECSDGVTIRKDAFKDDLPKKVPLCWMHQHDDPSAVLGHAVLENREDGVWANCSFNDTEAGKHAKNLVMHGDVSCLSIFANKLKKQGQNVMHGCIREVSLVLAGANPGAYIENVVSHGETLENAAWIGNGYMSDDNIVIAHSEDDYDEYDDYEDDEYDDYEDDEYDDYDDEEYDEYDDEEYDDYDDYDDYDEYDDIQHADDEEDEEDSEDGDEETVGDVFNSLNKKQKQLFYAMIGKAVEEERKNKSSNEGGNEEMKHNLFDTEAAQENCISHADMEGIFADAKRLGSLREAANEYCISHAVTNEAGETVTYGIANIDYLFPDYKAVNDTPDFIKRETDWVQKVMNGVHKSPFARIKSIHANITMDEARAKGYIKGHEKAEEVFSLLRRTTDPQTIYKKQKLDRDDIIDIVDFDVVAWIKGEMRIMLDEEIARAILIGDGRSAVAEDKIQESHVRPIWTDAALYTISKKVTFSAQATDDEKAKAVIKAAVKARKDYKGSGNPLLFTTEDWLTDMLLLEDTTGRRIYNNANELAVAMRVKEIVTVPVMEGQTREVSGSKFDLIGIIVNLNDYNLGADKGGSVNMFDDFDIDFNQYKYLIETRCSGALIKPYSAIVLETAHQGE